jgi:hypothetical protein
MHSTCYFCPILTKSRIYRQMFLKPFQSQVFTYPSEVELFHTYWWADWQTGGLTDRQTEGTRALRTAAVQTHIKINT